MAEGMQYSNKEGIMEVEVMAAFNQIVSKLTWPAFWPSDHIQAYLQSRVVGGWWWLGKMEVEVTITTSHPPLFTTPSHHPQPQPATITF